MQNSVKEQERVKQKRREPRSAKASRRVQDSIASRRDMLRPIERNEAHPLLVEDVFSADVRSDVPSDLLEAKERETKQVSSDAPRLLPIDSIRFETNRVPLVLSSMRIKFSSSVCSHQEPEGRVSE